MGDDAKFIIKAFLDWLDNYGPGDDYYMYSYDTLLELYDAWLAEERSKG